MAAGAIALAACAPGPGMAALENAVAEAEPFLLSPGDRLAITVFGDTDLSGEYDVDARGFIAMPLIGSIPAAGRTLPGLQGTIETELAKGFLVKPRVSIQIAALRPFYISGEVRTPGSYPAPPGLDAFKALAIAGGPTFRAVKNDYTITRGEGKDKRRFRANDDTPVLPGDAIYVGERLF